VAGKDEKDATVPPKAPRKKAAAPKSNPEQMAAEIERTREELAETLDAIAEKVSPKRVAKRTTKKVAAAVKDTAHDAATTVKDTAASAKDKVTGGTAAKPSGTAWAPDPGLSQMTAPTLVPDLPTPDPGLATPRDAPPYSTPSSYPAPSPTAYGSGSMIRPEYIAAGAAAALLAWLLLRKRR
jgi:hypothetical protein